MPILIKRYANRKLYNTQSSRYITLKGIALLLDEGQEVKVIDNETGEDITSVALSQILVDSKRSNSKTPTSLISQIMEQGGDALYDVLKRSVDDASDGIGEMQERFRRIITPDSGSSEEASSDPSSEGKQHGSRSRFANWIAYTSPDLDSAIENSVERVFKLLDLPRRRDVETLNQNLERVVAAVERLEQSVAVSISSGRHGNEPTLEHQAHQPPQSPSPNEEDSASERAPAAEQESVPVQD
jgi:polyhydroxyalkanoate synthesis repressor PhaR